jgi:coenzyme F420-reducing hydrogenase delta subunit
MVVGCRHNDCFYRFGNRWTKMRFEGERKPILRGRADRDRIRIHGGAETDKNSIEKDLNSFRVKLLELKQAAEISTAQAD